MSIQANLTFIEHMSKNNDWNMLLEPKNKTIPHGGLQTETPIVPDSFSETAENDPVATSTDKPESSRPRDKVISPSNP